MTTWRGWLPVVLAVGLVGVGLGLADAGRKDGALIVLGAGLLSAGVAVGAWLTHRAQDSQSPPSQHGSWNTADRPVVRLEEDR